MAPYHFNKAGEFIEKELAAGAFPGAGLMVSLHGARIYERYWGTYCSTGRRDTVLDNNVTHMLYSFPRA